jgi:tripartite-type tricarboxylate transporter receptor subunit TctC
MSGHVKVSALLAAVVAVASAMPLAAQDYPSKSVKIIVPFGVGGPADLYARVIGQYLSENLKQSFVVEPRPGAGGVTGTDAAAKSPADGYTLLMMSSTHTTNESLIANKPYQLMRDFAGVAPVNHSELLMVVHPSVPAKTVTEFIAYAKAKPNDLNYASSGPGTPYHMAGELFKAMTGTTIAHVPFKASGDARSAIAGGHVQMMFDAVPTMMEAAKAGQVRALASTGAKRSAVTPELPTVSEDGVPGYEAPIWIGLMAPKETPRPIVDRLNAEINKILAGGELKANWAKQGVSALVMKPAEFDAFLHKDIEKWAKVVQTAGLKAP